MFTKILDWLLRDVFGTPIDGTAQKLTVSSSAATSTAIAAGTRVRLQCTTDCYVCFGTTGVEASDDGTDMLFLAGPPEVFTVDDTHVYVSCIKKEATDSDGVLSIAPLAGYRVP
jgi:hypothetical protein